MDLEKFRNYCLSLKGATEGFPFGEDTLVFTVGGKMFALTNIDFFESINLKADPEDAIDQRERHASVKPGFHMNKKHWNTIEMDGSINDAQVLEWTRQSYDLVVKGLPKKIRKDLQ